MPKILNNTPFAFAPIEARADPAQPMLTLLVKATFDIVPNAPATLAKTQRPIQADTPHMDDLGRSLAWPDDMVPYKPNTGFFIVGSFHQPGQKPAPTGRAAFSFGPFSKELAFAGPRTAALQRNGTWELRDHQPMTMVPLRWELSYGGLKDRRNPYGMGQKTERIDGQTIRRLPQIEHPAYLCTNNGAPIPANFTCVPPSFPERRRKLGTRDQEWALFRAPLLPRDFDPSFFNAAPEDQQAGNYPRGDETITLVNLHPQHPELTFALPGLRIRVAALRQTPAGLAPEDVPMVIDTVIPVPDDNQLVLLFRGRIPLHTSDWETELPWLSCTAQPLGQPIPDPGAALLAQSKKQDDAAAAAAKMETDQLNAEIAKLLPKANLPPALHALVLSDADPAQVFDALGTHLEALLADLTKDLPPAP